MYNCCLIYFLLAISFVLQATIEHNTFFIFRSCHEKELLIDGQKPPQIDTVVVTNGKNGTTKREMVGCESKEEIV